MMFVSIGLIERFCFPHLVTSAKLAIRLKKVYVVAAHIILCHSNNGTGETLLTMMVSRMLRYITRKLSNFSFLYKVSLERTEKDLPLTWFQTINH